MPRPPMPPPLAEAALGPPAAPLLRTVGPATKRPAALALALDQPAPPGVEGTAPPLEIGALYRAHAQSVARWAARLGGPQSDIEDLVQEVFLTAHRHLAGFRGDAKITTWLFRITRNAVRHRRRKEWLSRFLRGSAEDAAGHLPSQRPTPVEELERRRAEATVYQVLDGMSEKYRTAFILFEMEQLSGEEIAAMLELKVATVWVWLHRARAQFLQGVEARAKAEAEGMNRPKQDKTAQRRQAT